MIQDVNNEELPIYGGFLLFQFFCKSKTLKKINKTYLKNLHGSHFQKKYQLRSQTRIF